MDLFSRARHRSLVVAAGLLIAVGAGCTERVADAPNVEGVRSELSLVETDSRLGGAQPALTDSSIRIGPSSTGPGAIDPGAVDPGAVDPGAVDPGAVDPGIITAFGTTHAFAVEQGGAEFAVEAKTARDGVISVLAQGVGTVDELEITAFPLGNRRAPDVVGADIVHRSGALRHELAGKLRVPPEAQAALALAQTNALLDEVQGRDYGYPLNDPSNPFSAVVGALQARAVVDAGLASAVLAIRMAGGAIEAREKPQKQTWTLTDVAALAYLYADGDPKPGDSNTPKVVKPEVAPCWKGCKVSEGKLDSGCAGAKLDVAGVVTTTLVVSQFKGTSKCYGSCTPESGCTGQWKRADGPLKDEICKSIAANKAWWKKVANLLFGGAFTRQYDLSTGVRAFGLHPNPGCVTDGKQDFATGPDFSLKVYGTEVVSLKSSIREGHLATVAESRVGGGLTICHAGDVAPDERAGLTVSNFLTVASHINQECDEKGTTCTIPPIPADPCAAQKKGG